LPAKALKEMFNK